MIARARAPRLACRAEARESWCRRVDLNNRPSPYESVALPLSYTGKLSNL
jgi:hypothetical protein